MPDEWRESTITPICKDKGDHMNCCNYRGITLLSHTMKHWERIIDQRLRDIVSISDGQFGFKSGVGTTDAIFVIRTLCEKYREGNKPLDMVFVDLEKAYDTVPCEVLRRCTCGNRISQRGTHEWFRICTRALPLAWRLSEVSVHVLRLGLASTKVRHLARSYSSC